MDIITPDDQKNFDDLYIVFSKMDCDLLRVLNDQNQSLTGIPTFDCILFSLTLSILMLHLGADFIEI